MPSGGARVGAGRKSKPAELKILEGNPGCREIKVLKIVSPIEIPEKPPDYLVDEAKRVYTKTLEWLKSIGCSQGIMPYHLEEYAVNKAHWLECERAVTTRGVIMKDPTNGKPIVSPYVVAAQSYLKLTNDVWAKIYAVIRESKLTKWDDKNPNDDIMARLLKDDD